MLTSSFLFVLDYCAAAWNWIFLLKGSEKSSDFENILQGTWCGLSEKWDFTVYLQAITETFVILSSKYITGGRVGMNISSVESF